MLNTVVHDRYKIVKKLGEGAMGEVFLAEHVSLHRQEALKVLQVELAAEREFVSRFRREARVLNQVQHPGIVGVHDFGQLPDGRYFLSMEYVEGSRLDEVLHRTGALPVARALGIAVQLCAAVDHAHTAGIIHRDLKPENIMLVERPGHGEVVKVLDFGLAKILAPNHVDSVPQTKLGQIFGTPHYMSPQQILGLPIDTRTDIYSIGCILFELLTGQPPFDGGLMDLVLAHKMTPPPRPSDRNPRAKISPQLDAIVLRCLEKDPANRYFSASEVATVLQKVPEAKRTPSERGKRFPKVSTDFGSAQLTEPSSERFRMSVMATLMAGSADEGEEPVAAAREDVRSAIRELAEALISRGADNVALIMAVANLKEASERLGRCDADLNTIERRTEETDAAARKREGALRVALSDLQFVQQDAQERDATLDGEIAAQVRELEARLARMAEEHEREVRALTDHAVELAAARATAADQIETIDQALARHVDELGPRFQHDLGIAVLIDHVHAAREHVERLERPPRRR